MGDYPKIERLKVANFQSLAEADIELGGLTVIVGPSNSGKSALLRALKAVVRNVNSPSAVRVGKTTFTSEIEFSGNAVAIERGKSQSTYRTWKPDGSEDVYTKSGRSVPEEVQTLLGLPDPDGPDLTFSSQIDPPFLLSETGTTAAKMLGDLTNVSKLHAAAKEANRRRLEASRLAEVRKKDFAAVSERMHTEFSDLREHAAALRDARDRLDAVSASVLEAEKVEALLSDLHLLDSAEEDLRTRLGELPEPADIEALAEKAGELMGMRHALIDLISDFSKCADVEERLAAEAQAAAEAEEKLGEEYHALLVEAGTCPTCNQKVSA